MRIGAVLAYRTLSAWPSPWCSPRKASEPVAEAITDEPMTINSDQRQTSLNDRWYKPLRRCKTLVA